MDFTNDLGPCHKVLDGVGWDGDTHAMIIPNFLSNSSYEINRNCIQKQMLAHHFPHNYNRRCSQMVPEVAGAINPSCPNHTNFSPTSRCEIVGNAIIIGCQIVHANISACSTFLLWCTTTCITTLSPQLRGSKVGPCGQTTSFELGGPHVLCTSEMWMSKCMSWLSQMLLYRLDCDGPPWKSLWETNSPTKYALSI